MKGIEKKLKEILQGKDYLEYCDILNQYNTELSQLGVNFRIYFYFERGEKQGSYGVELQNKEFSKNQITALINNKFASITYDSITITVWCDEKRYSYNEKLNICTGSL